MPKPTQKTYDVSFRKVDPSSSHFVKIGIAFSTDKGRIDIKLDALPIGEWDGRLMLFPKE